MINSEFVQALEPYVDFIQVCPEVDIGLGIPRASVKLVLFNGNYELYQTEHDRIVTPEMDKYAHEVLTGIPEIEGAILKGGSPTCGIKNVKKYQSTKKVHIPLKG